MGAASAVGARCYNDNDVIMGMRMRAQR